MALCVIRRRNLGKSEGYWKTFVVKRGNKKRALGKGEKKEEQCRWKKIVSWTKRKPMLRTSQRMGVKSEDSRDPNRRPGRDACVIGVITGDAGCNGPNTQAMLKGGANSRSAQIEMHAGVIRDPQKLQQNHSQSVRAHSTRQIHCKTEQYKWMHSHKYTQQGQAAPCSQIKYKNDNKWAEWCWNYTFYVIGLLRKSTWWIL